MNGGEAFLLPAGLGDLLPPAAGFEAGLVDRLMAQLALWGYERVKPPLIEFEDSLLAGPGAAMSAHTFRLMDPLSRRMMGLRADMTPQVARIAASRLAHAPRPLRLSYAGQVLRVAGEPLRPERQLGQAGIELIGAEGAPADAEVILLAGEALGALGLGDLAIDLTLPVLVPLLLDEAGIGGGRRADLIAALDRKDAQALRGESGDLARRLEPLMRIAGPAEAAAARLRGLALPPAAAAARDRLVEIAGIVGAAAPDLALTVDVTDHRGFEYHSGPAFSLIARKAQIEIGRGGRYVNQAGESATGFSLYLGALIEALPAPERRQRLFLPFGTASEPAARLRREGRIVVQGLAPAPDARAEARRLGCAWVYLDGEIVAVEE